MKLLILTQYFPPEVGAPQNRLFELALRLQQKGVQVEVLTAMPNYPQMQIQPQYKGKHYLKEELQGVKIQRTWIYVSKNKTIIHRLLNYFSFVFSSLFYGLLHLEHKDILLVESPPLFLGITAYILSKCKKAKMVFNVSDLWPESAEKLNIINNHLLLKLATKLEEFLYKHATLITGQTQGICKNISSRFPKKKVYWLKNGVDIKFYDVNKKINSVFREKHGFSSDDFICFYGGIIGLAQGLEVILYAAKLLLDKPFIKFVILGSGPDKERLLSIKEKENLNNVFFFDAVPKSKMQEIIIQTDATIVPLKKLDLFKGALPSKIFENLALKKPIILGIEGEAKELFIDQGQCGVSFIPEDYKDLKDKILYIYNNPNVAKQMGDNGLAYATKNFNRDIIAEDFYKVLTTLL